MTMTMTKEAWMQVLQSASVPELEAALHEKDTPKTLLHWACQLPNLDLPVLQCLVQRFPKQLTFADQAGRIPLHYVCQHRSFSALSLLHVLLQAAPDTILMPLFETNVHTISGTDGSSGILPAVLAHRSLTPPTLVQYLLRRQIEAHGGLVLRHEDLMHLEWNEGSFVEHVAVALKTTSPTIIQQVCLEECRLTYESWQTLQVALQQLPANTLQKLQLLHLHIWHAHPDVRYHNQNHHNNNHHHEQEQPLSQREMVEADVALWQRLVDHHKCSLQQLELPQFYALTTTTVNRVAQHLANQEFADLQVLDARTCIQQPAIWDTTPLAKALINPKCGLQKLALQTATVEGYQTLLQALHNNRSVLVFQIGDIVPNGEKDIVYEIENENLDNTSQQPIPWPELRLATQHMLQRNTALERFLAPRPLIHCHSIQLYLKLNRDYHRRDVGHWSPGLLAHVLAKVKLEAAHTTNSPPTTKSWYFPTHEPVPIQDPNSALFYFLQSRPDILLSKQ